MEDAMNSGWNLPPGVSVADIEAAQDAPDVFVSWESFTESHPDAATAIEAAFAPVLWRYVGEMEAQRRDGDALAALGRMVTNEWREFREKRAGEWIQERNG